MGRFEKQGLRTIIIKESLEIVVIQGSYGIWKEEEHEEEHVVPETHSDRTIQSDKTMRSLRDVMERDWLKWK